MALKYCALSTYSSLETICIYNYANGLSCVLAGRMFIAVPHFSLEQVAIDACLVGSNGYLHA